MAGVIGDINNNLMGLQQLAMGRQQVEQAKAKEDDRKIASDSLRRFYESQQSGSPDYSLMNEAVLRSPELAQNVLNHIGIQEKRQGQDAASFVSRSFNAIDDPQRFIPMAQARAEYLASSGRDPKDTIALIEMVQSGNAAGAKKELQAVAAALTNQGYLDKDVYGQLAGAEERARKAALEERGMRVEERSLSSSALGNTSSNIREIEYYNKMPEGPAKEAVGRKLGLLPNWGYDAENARAVAEAKAAGGAAGKSQTEASMDLPKIESSAAKVTGLVNELLNHKGKSSALGASSYLPSIRGTERAGFENRLKQIQGDAFLKAFESLKGGGAITEVEGQKATQALNRMNETVSEEEFDSAAKDFISEVNRFKEIAAQRAGKPADKKESTLSGLDRQAYEWAKSNPNDPRSAQILNKLGVQ